MSENRPSGIGTFWVTEEYVHGPRQRQPDDFIKESFRTIGTGHIKATRGMLKNGRMVTQSYVRKIHPTEYSFLAKKQAHWSCPILHKEEHRTFVSHSVYAFRWIAGQDAKRMRGRYYIRIIPTKGLYVIYRNRKKRK